MERSSLACVLVVAAVLIFAFPTIRAGGMAGEVSFIGASSSGDFGTGVETEVQSMILRYTTGREFQFRVDLPLLRVRSGLGTVLTGVGTTPIGEQGVRWRRDGGMERGSGSASAAAVEDPLAPDEAAPWSTGAGDLRLAVSQRVAGGGVKLHRIDVVGDIKLPTADESAGLGTGKTDYRLGVSAEYRFWSATGFAGVAWNRLGDPDWGRLDDVFDGYVGLESDAIVGGRLVASSWVETIGEAVPGAGTRTALGAGIRTTGKIRWRLQASTGFGDSAEDLTLLVGVSMGLGPSGPGARGARR